MIHLFSAIFKFAFITGQNKVIKNFQKVIDNVKMTCYNVNKKIQKQLSPIMQGVDLGQKPFVCIVH